MSDQTAVIEDEILTALDQAFATRDFSEAAELMTKLEQAYNLSEDDLSDSSGKQSDLQREQAAVARSLRDSGNITEGEDVATLNRFGLTYATTQYSRSLVVYIGRIIIENHEALAGSGELDDLITVVRTGITDLQSAEDELASQTNEVETITQNVETPPTITISATADRTNLGIDDTTTAKITVINSSDQAATDVTVTVTTPNGITTPDSNTTVTRISAGDKATTEVMLRGTESGIQAIDIAAKTAAETTAASTLLTISVTSTGGENGQDSGGYFGVGRDNSRGIIGGIIAAGLAGSGYLAYRFGSDEDDNNGIRQEQSSQRSGRARERQPSQHVSGTSKEQPSQRSSRTREGEASQHRSDRATRRSTQYCPECGETLSIEAQKCTNCGSRLD